MSIEHIKAAYAKGHPPAAIATLLGHEVGYVKDILGIKDDKSLPIDKEALRLMAIDTLASLIRDMQNSPTAFKPGEIIAACKEALDRTEGKAVQSMVVDARTTVTYNNVMSLDPAEAYRLMVSGSAKVSGLPVIDVIVDGGGDTADVGAGVDVGEGGSDITHQKSERLP